jgi:hypothetical protein
MAGLNELNTHAEEPTEDQEYIDKMVAKANGNALTTETQDVEEEQGEETTEDNSDNQEETPDWLPDKFKSPEELAKAYSELEKKLGENPVDKREDLDAEEATPPTEINYEEMASEYWSEGSLSDTRYKELEDMGVPKQIVDGYIAGQQAILNSVQGSVFNEVGGEAQYQEMVAWAKDNLSESEVAIYDQSVNTNDLDQTLYAVKGLHARYASEQGVEPKLIQGDNAPVSSGAYASAAEVKRDMSDPRYSKDPAFRKKVENKLSKSNVF